MTTSRTGPDAGTVQARARVKGPLPLLGPAFVTAIAYVDPGNFAPNIAAGSRYGYLLVWVVIVSNLMAMLIQYLSAKAGIATAESLPALCRRYLPRPVVRCLWVQAEVVAMATDMAEVVGGALALQLLFDLPLLVGGLITAAVAFALLGFQTRGHRPFETAITGLLAVIFAGSATTWWLEGCNRCQSSTAPSRASTAATVCCSRRALLGATVMPHAIYLHSALTNDRYVADTQDQRRALLRSQRVDVIVAMTIAGLMNLALLVLAAKLFAGDASSVDTIEGAHAALGAKLGSGAALLFALALLASGLAASSVGTYSGQVVMEGFPRRKIPLVIRRSVTLFPSVVVLAFRVDPTKALVTSQVVLSFGIAFALVPLVLFTRRRDVMGELTNKALTTAVAWLVAIESPKKKLCARSNPTPRRHRIHCETTT
ncbi:MAG: Nramp family divalent metal transporter [Nocardioidaceae bacterium]